MFWGMNRLADLIAASEGKTKTRVAADLGVTDTTVARWMTGRVAIPTRRALQLADYFGVSPAWVMGWEDNGENGNDSERKAA